MTIQQQLETFADNPVVDGVRWEANYYEELVDGFSTFICGRQIHIYAVLDTGEESIFFKWNLNAIELFGLPMKDKEITASTPADACREALRICRERVAELAGALGMWIDDSEIYLKSVELNPIVPERDLDTEKLDYKTYLALKTHAVASSQLMAKWVLEKLLNQPTGVK